VTRQNVGACQTQIRIDQVTFGTSVTVPLIGSGFLSRSLSSAFLPIRWGTQSQESTQVYRSLLLFHSASTSSAWRRSLRCGPEVATTAGRLVTFAESTGRLNARTQNCARRFNPTGSHCPRVPFPSFRLVNPLADGEAATDSKVWGLVVGDLYG